MQQSKQPKIEIKDLEFNNCFKMNKITAYLIFLWIVAVVTASYPTFVQGQVICNDRSLMLKSLEKSYGEKIAEQGVDEGSLVVITVNLQGKWSLLITPKGKPNTFCVPVTGTDWIQESNISKGIAFNGSVLSIIHKEDGVWNMLYLDSNTGSVQDVTTGYGWERIIDFNKLSN